MKYTAFLVVFFLTFQGLSISAGDSQEPSYKSSLGLAWTIGVYGGNQSELQKRISGKIADGFSPVAFEINPGGTNYVLYVKSTTKSSVRIDEFTKKDLSQGLNELYLIGFNPQDVCFRGDRIFVLSVADELDKTKIAGNIVKAKANIQDINAVLKKQVELGFVPLGISYDNGEVWIFLQQDPRIPFKEARLDSFANLDGMDLINGIDKKILEGYTVVGLTNSVLDKKTNRILVLFLK